MSAPRDDKDRQTMPQGADDLVPPTPAASLKPATKEQQSWGDKYKAKALHLFRNVGINYIVNFAISAVFTYKVEDKVARYFKPAIDRAVAGVNSNLAKASVKFIAEYFTITQLLLCGGHSILPIMKYTHDNRKALEFAVGHRFDQLQELTGNGNAASKQRLEEYKVIKDIFKARPETLSDESKALLAKNGIGDNLQFNEKRSTWGHILKARLGGVATTTALSVGLALGSASGKPWLNFDNLATNKAGPIIGQKFIKPVFGRAVDNHNLLGRFTFIELIYTLVSKLGFDRIERKQYIKQQQAEQEAAAHRLVVDEKVLQADSAQDTTSARSHAAAFADRATAQEARSKIVSNGAQDFRARETLKPGEPAAASL